ncbi:hypothetical protein ACQ4LE_005283 [Meloidogyne hapla]
MEDRTMKINGKSGLDFLITDNGIRHQMISHMPEFMESKQLTISIENYRYIIIIDTKFWQGYFQLNLGDALTDNDEKEIIGFMKKYIVPFLNSRSYPLGMDDWQRLNIWLKGYVDELLEKYFTGDVKDSMHTKVNY